VVLHICWTEDSPVRSVETPCWASHRWFPEWSVPLRCNCQRTKIKCLVVMIIKKNHTHTHSKHTHTHTHARAHTQNWNNIKTKTNCKCNLKFKYSQICLQRRAVTLGSRNWWLYKTDSCLGQIVLKGNVLHRATDKLVT
jgi:hypothetical protein